MVKGPNRSLRHGYDGRFEEDGTLRVRVSHRIVDAINFCDALEGKWLHEGLHPHGAVPPEIDLLMDEALLLDTTTAKLCTVKYNIISFCPGFLRL